MIYITSDSSLSPRIFKQALDKHITGAAITTSNEIRTRAAAAGPNIRHCEIKNECGTAVEKSSVLVVILSDTGGRFSVSPSVSTHNSGKCDSFFCSGTKTAAEELHKCNYKYTRNPIDKIPGSRETSYLEYEVKTASAMMKPVILLYDSAKGEPARVPQWYKNTAVNEILRLPYTDEAMQKIVKQIKILIKFKTK